MDCKFSRRKFLVFYFGGVWWVGIETGWRFLLEGLGSRRLNALVDSYSCRYDGDGSWRRASTFAGYAPGSRM